MEHDRRLRIVLQRLEEANVILDAEKCAFSRHKISFLGYTLDERDIQADPDKTMAIRSICTPKTLTDLHRFMGMVSHLGKLSPKIATLSEP